MLRTSVFGHPGRATAAAMRPRLSLQDKRLTLAAATFGSFVALLDSTVVGIALRAIRSDLGGGLESQQWIVNAYLLMLGSLILIGGSLGDVFGERRLCSSWARRGSESRRRDARWPRASSR
jgi:hypothetical protein